MMAVEAEAGLISGLFEVDWHIHIWLIHKDPVVWNALKVRRL